MLANGTKLGYKTGESESSFKDLPGLKEIPEMGEDIEKVENTCLTDPHKVYEKGIGDLSDMKYKFKYDNTKAESPYRVLSAAADKGTVLTFQETLPDKTITEFTGQVAVKRTGGGVNGVIEFEATIAVQSIKRTDPAQEVEDERKYRWIR